jgi:hypothetical protein
MDADEGGNELTRGKRSKRQEKKNEHTAEHARQYDYPMR